MLVVDAVALFRALVTEDEVACGRSPGRSHVRAVAEKNLNAKRLLRDGREDSATVGRRTNELGICGRRTPRKHESAVVEVTVA